MDSRQLTIMFTDLQGFTARTSNSTRDFFIDLLERHEQLAKPIFQQYGGVVIKEIGDAFMVAFESPTNAVLCGIKLQNEIYNQNQTVPEHSQLRMRVAISSGDVHVRNNDVFGDAVNIAARLESSARADDVYFTESVYHAMKKTEMPPILYMGGHMFKGIPTRVKVYKILGEYSRDRLRKKIKKNKIKRAIRYTFAAAIIATLMIMLFGSASAFDRMADFLNATMLG